MSASLRQFNKFVKEQIARSKAERPPPAGNPEAAAGGTKVGGKVFSGKTDDGVDVDLLSGDAEVRADGSATGKGAIAKAGINGLTGTVGEVEIAPGKATATGAKVELDVAKATGALPPGVVAKADVSVGAASAEKRVFDDGVAVGLEASSVGGSVTFGTSGTTKADGKTPSDRDQTVRFGLSEGPGFAGRIHFADEDGDGNPEIGVGADFGFVSFDVKTEDPLRTAATLANVGSPLSLADTLTDDGSNMTKDALGALGLPKEGTLEKGVGIFKKIVGLPVPPPKTPDPGSGDAGIPPTTGNPPSPVHADPVHADLVHGGEPEHECAPAQDGEYAASKYAGPAGGGETYAAVPEGGNTAPEYSAPLVGSGAAPECAPPPEGGA